MVRYVRSELLRDHSVGISFAYSKKYRIKWLFPKLLFCYGRMTIRRSSSMSKLPEGMDLLLDKELQCVTLVESLGATGGTQPKVTGVSLLEPMLDDMELFDMTDRMRHHLEQTA